jgi:hypothetical protein
MRVAIRLDDAKWSRGSAFNQLRIPGFERTIEIFFFSHRCLVDLLTDATLLFDSFHGLLSSSNTKTIHRFQALSVRVIDWPKSMFACRKAKTLGSEAAVHALPEQKLLSAAFHAPNPSCDDTVQDDATSRAVSSSNSAIVETTYCQ